MRACVRMCMCVCVFECVCACVCACAATAVSFLPYRNEQDVYFVVLGGTAARVSQVTFFPSTMGLKQKQACSSPISRDSDTTKNSPSSRNKKYLATRARHLLRQLTSKDKETVSGSKRIVIVKFQLACA